MARYLIPTSYMNINLYKDLIRTYWSESYSIIVGERVGPLSLLMDSVLIIVIKHITHKASSDVR